MNTDIVEIASSFNKVSKGDVSIIIEKILNDDNQNIPINEKAMLYKYFIDSLRLDLKNPMNDVLSFDKNEMNYYHVFNGVMYATDGKIMMFKKTNLADGYYDKALNPVSPKRIISVDAFKTIIKNASKYTEQVSFKNTIETDIPIKKSQYVVVFENDAGEMPSYSDKYVGLSHLYYRMIGKPVQLFHANGMFSGTLNNDIRYIVMGIVL